ncbi:MAG: hypothetical protein WA949_19300 [Phormidesmis sp.]
MAGENEINNGSINIQGDTERSTIILGNGNTVSYTKNILAPGAVESSDNMALQEIEDAYRRAAETTSGLEVFSKGYGIYAEKALKYIKRIDIRSCSREFKYDFHTMIETTEDFILLHKYVAGRAGWTPIGLVKSFAYFFSGSSKISTYINAMEKISTYGNS